MANASTEILLNSDSDEGTNVSENENPIHHSRQPFPSPSVIPASDDDVTASGSKSNHFRSEHFSIRGRESSNGKSAAQDLTPVIRKHTTASVSPAYLSSLSGAVTSPPENSRGRSRGLLSPLSQFNKKNSGSSSKSKTGSSASVESLSNQEQSHKSHPKPSSSSKGRSLEKSERPDKALPMNKPPNPIPIPPPSKSIFTGKDHDLLYRHPSSPNNSLCTPGIGNLTSTPMLSNTRKVNQLDILDLTAISEDIDEIQNSIQPTSTPQHKTNQKPRGFGRNRQIIHSSSSSSDEEGPNTDRPAVKSQSLETETGQDNSELELIDLSSRIDNLNLDKHKKQFTFKSKTPNTNSAEGKNSEILDNDDESFSSAFGSDSIHLTTTDDDSPEVIEQRQPRRVDPLPALPKKGLPTNEPRIKFIDLPAAHQGPIASVAGSAELQIGVRSAIGKLAETILSIPKEGAKSENPTGLRVDLFDHQRYGLEWLSWREQQFPGGGILADEMGLGKTIMIIALVLKSRMQTATKPRTDSSWISSDTRSLVPSRSTLVVVPASVLLQWEDEIQKKARGMRVCKYHGPSRTKSAAGLVQNDFVLTTYQTLGSDIPKLSEEKYTKCSSPLLRVQWERIVLDEGHNIRNATTLAAQAACRLNANYRWVVTGTPVHNRPADLHSLVKFLRLVPFDDPKVWDFWIGMKAVSAANAERLNVIGKALILRRTKEEVQLGGGNVKSIPPKTVVDVKIQLTPEERQIYDHLFAFAESQFKLFMKNQEEAHKELQTAANNYVAGRPKAPAGSREVNFTHIFTLILRLRQASVAPYLITTMLEDETSDVDLSEAFDPLNQADVISRRNPVFSETFQSAKLRRLYQDLEDLRAKCIAENRPMEKVVVVSQWTTLLDVVHSHLKEKGFSMTTISGKVKISDRMDIMATFNNNPRKPQIMLLSLAAGGVGLNLVGANHAFFLDLHYNPQLEAQAQDRIHRFGQTKACTIIRYISSDTMEERVATLQVGKLELANGLLSTSKKKAGSGLSLQDMRLLFAV